MVEQELGHLGASVNLRTVLRGASLDQTRERCCAHPATAATERRLGPCARSRRRAELAYLGGNTANIYVEERTHLAPPIEGNVGSELDVKPRS